MNAMQPHKPRVRDNRMSPAKEWRLEGVKFEDHPRGDSDRFRGRKPLPQYTESHTGCAADLCANGAF